jgi:DNA-binding response OmpR family regulator
MKILLVEDDKPTGSVLATALTENHYSVNLVTDGQKALELARAIEYDLILLDIIIPKLDGISVCKQLRASGYLNPILLLTAKDSSDDRVMGLDAGADDYVVKPFDLPELLARIRALLRRGKSLSSVVMTWENIFLDPINSEVTCNGQRLHLTPKEYCLLELFLCNPKRVFSRSAILDKLWDFAESPGEETVSTHIKCLRQKLKAAGASDPVETVHGLGYRLRQPAEEKQPKAELTASAKVKKMAESRQSLKSKTSKIWLKHKDTLIEQVAVLESATEQLIANNLTTELHQKAKDEAHKLAGSLGIFGLAEGSRLSRELEGLLQPEIILSSGQILQIAELTQALRRELDNAVTNATTPAAKKTIYSPLILIVDDDLVLAEQIRTEAISWGMRVEVATDLTVARQMIAQTPPDVILLDLNFPSATEDGLTLLRELANRIPKIPAIAFTGRESLADRVQVAELGGCAFLHKPLPTHEILKALTEALKPQPTNPGNRIMLVDDDKVILETLSQQLSCLGFEVATLNNPKQFWENLTSFHPNLLVLDMKMPDFDGVQLCQAVRCDPYWQHLTILFFSAHTTVEEINRAFAAGADDYISKSLEGQEIAQRIARRLRRNPLPIGDRES